MTGGRERLVELARAKPIPPYSLNEELTLFCPREDLAGLELPAVRAYHRWLLREYRPPPGGEPAVLLLPGQKVKPCTLSDEHPAISGMLLAAGFRPLQRGDWPASLARIAPPELLANAPLAGHGLRIDRAVVSEPFGLVPYDAVYRWRDRPSPAVATTTPACSSTAALPAPGGRTAPWCGSAAPGAGATPSGRRTWRSTTGSACCWPRASSAGATGTPRCSATSPPGSPTAPSSATRPSGAPPGLPTGRRVGDLAPGLVTLVPDGRELAALRRDQGGHLPADLLTRAWCLRLLLDRLDAVAEAAAPR